MKRTFLLFFLNALIINANGQRSLFVYLQSESEQPFYLKMGERIFSSAAKGYLILPHLRDSSYSFSIGIPGKNSNEQKFSVKMNGKDHGYVLKNFEEKGWGLFDLQTLAVQMANNNPAEPETKKEAVKKDESAFTQILAKASDDSTLLEKPDLAGVAEKKTEPEVREIESKQEEKTEVKNPDSVFQKSSEPVLISGKDKSGNTAENKIEGTEKVNNQPPAQEFKRSVVERKSESSTTEGIGIVFIDEYSDGKKDTIRILIPKTTDNLKQIVSEKDGKKREEEKKFLEIPDKEKADSVPQIEAVPVAVTSAPKPVNKTTHCKSVAGENDFLKLRKNMAGFSDDEEMINEAKKMFRSKCFTTVQIKNLSLLFLTDAGKYKFFDSSYEYVSDVENFPTLQAELKEEYFINRFKAMLR